MTFSIVGRCQKTGMFGMAISSSSPAVAARCAYARVGVGAVATQNITDPRLGQSGLDLLAGGASAETALDALRKSPFIDYRQLTLIDRDGRTAGYSGSGTLGIHSIAHGRNAVAAGNLLADAAVPAAMSEAFNQDEAPFPERLLAALAAGLDAGGEAGPVHSAGLLIVREVEWPVIDLRVDWSDSPIADLERLWTIYAPQMEDYVRRALDPSAAPSFGVPGDN
jgi:uncharacterized Ntn-hydrolase superfamily protein